MTRPPQAKTPRPAMSRSEMMARVRSTDTQPEMCVRRALWAEGLRYRLHNKTITGKPDLLFLDRRVALFVHGCFWHAHTGCVRHRIPKSRVEWWTAKIERTKERDVEVQTRLTAAGWIVLVIWECEAQVPANVVQLARAIKALPRWRRSARGPMASST
jgi:DNA mismatch endonuclease (patch repair protein)